MTVPPCATVMLGGAETVNAGTWICSCMVVDEVRLPDFPVTVNVEVPATADAEAVSVRVLVPMDGFGRMDAVTPAGKPVTQEK